MGAWLLLVALLAAPPPPVDAADAAEADEAAANAASEAASDPATLARARELFEAGSAAYARTHYDVAVEAFEEAYRLAPRPSVVFSLAQALRLQYFLDGDPKKLRRAVALYREYVDTVRTGGRRDDASQHLRDLVPLMQRDAEPAADAPARLIVSADASGAQARIDGGDPRPIPATFEVAPGARRLVVEAPEHEPRTIETTAVAGSTVALNVTLTPQPGALTVRAPAGAQVEIDGRPLGPAPLPPIALAPGQHRVVVVESGRVPFVQTVAVERAQALTIEAPLEVTGQRVAAWVLYGATGALLAGAGVAVGFALDAQSDAQAIEARWRTDGLAPAEVTRYQSRVDARDQRTALAIGLGAGAAALAGLATALYVFDDAVPPPEATVRPTLGPTGAGIGGAWRF
ncbi:MAG: PEGA domain-containing protein [bacterium]|nr:PEGA domain-containing protein [Myxococcales bacterium]MCB9543903.1 PEGA domain-containing protein [Myxococcales bacterium]